LKNQSPSKKVWGNLAKGKSTFKLTTLNFPSEILVDLGNFNNPIPTGFQQEDGFSWGENKISLDEKYSVSVDLKR